MDTHGRKRSFDTFHDKDKVNSWAQENNTSPEDAFIASSSKYKFRCHECKSTFEIPLVEIFMYNKWCSKCRHINYNNLES